MGSPQVYELASLHAITRAWWYLDAGVILTRVLF